MAKERGSSATLDGDFGSDLEALVSRHRDHACVGLILDSSVAIVAGRRGDTVQALLQGAIDAAGDKEAALWFGVIDAGPSQEPAGHETCRLALMYISMYT